MIGRVYRRSAKVRRRASQKTTVSGISMSPSEADSIETDLSTAFALDRPEALKLPLVFNSPHSGRVYPQAFLAASRLDSLTLRRSEDAYVEELFSFVTS